MLSRDAILTVNDLKISDPIEVPEWGGVVHVRGMTAAEKVSLYEPLRTDDKDAGKVFIAALLVRTICDETGARLFGDDDTVLLNSKSSAAIERLFVEAQRINALGADANEARLKN